MANAVAKFRWKSTGRILAEEELVEQRQFRVKGSLGRRASTPLGGLNRPVGASAKHL
jgi:hypothetical protein